MNKSLIDGSPEEDSGASTADRYRFQYCCAASRLLGALSRGTDCELVCEWHEDFLVSWETHVEAVSVKHREDHRPAWSLSSLVSDDGKLGHLFESFLRNESLACRFESNLGHTHAVTKLWSEDPSEKTQARRTLAEGLNGSAEDTNRFVDKLQITPSVPSRQHIDAAYESRFAAFALDELGLNVQPRDALRIAVGLIANASREKILDEDWIKILTAAPAEREDVIRTCNLMARTVSTETLRSALVDAETYKVPKLATLDPSEPEPPETTLTLKLEKGGLGPSVVDSARHLRSLWYAHKAKHRDLPHREVELNSLEEWVQLQANAAETQNLSVDTPYGGAMYSELMELLTSNVPEATRFDDQNPALLSGAAFELTDRCSIWWSPRFEIKHDE